jgi:hypothetical protein
MTLAAAERIIPKVGVHRRVPFAEYVAWDAMNWHTLEPFRVSAKLGRLAMTLPDDASDAQALGGAFHSAVLEPALFDTEYAAMPQFDGHPNSNAHKQAKADWIEANREKVAIAPRERAALLAMSQAVRAHPIAAAILRGAGKNELSIVWRDKPTGVLCKGRVDRVCRVKIGVLDGAAANPNDDALCLIDFKTTRAIGIEAFDKEIAKFAYHAQLAMYLDGLNALDPAPLHPLHRRRRERAALRRHRPQSRRDRHRARQAAVPPPSQSPAEL